VLLAGCADPRVQEALALVQAQLKARHLQAAQEERERDREHLLAAEADAAAAAWRGGMGLDGDGDSAMAAASQDDEEVLRILLATRQQCIRDPEARRALLQLHAGANGGGGGQHAEGWQQQLGILFTEGAKPKRQRKEGDQGAAADRHA
jgi:hypothetical protein